MNFDLAAVEPEGLLLTLDTGDRLHYLDWGASSDRLGLAGAELPGVLLLHGLSQTAWSWAPVARRLCRTMHVVAIDLRGHGVSEAPRDGYDLDSLAYDVLTVAVANGWGRGAGGQPCIVVGHGLGAMVAATAGLLEPDSVAGVGLIDAGWDDLAEATGLTAEEFLRGLAEPPEVMRSMTAYLDDRRDYDPASWDDDQERAARAAVDEKHAGHVAPVLRAHAQRALVEAMFEYRPRHAIRQLSMPLLVCVAEAGAADDGQVRERRLALNESLALREAAGLSPALVVRFPGVGHNLMRYRPAEVAAGVLALATSGDRRDAPA